MIAFLTRVIHVEKREIKGESDLCTKLYTLSTGFCKKNDMEISFSERTKVLAIFNKNVENQKKASISVDRFNFKNM